MVTKKKATSKTTTKKKGKKKMAVFDTKPDKPQEDKPKDQPQKAKDKPKNGEDDPLKGIQEREAAAQEPTKKVERGEVKPAVPKPETFEEKKPEQMTGPEQDAMMASGGVLPKEQAEKEEKEQAKAAGAQPK